MAPRKTKNKLNQALNQATPADQASEPHFRAADFNPSQQKIKPNKPDSDHTTDTAAKPSPATPDESIADLTAKLRQLEQEHEGLTSKNADLNQRLLRCHAERENERTRLQREMKNARAYALSDFAKELVVVADHLERGLDNTDATDPAQKAVAEGLQMTYDALLKVLAQHNIEQLNPLGEAFDPDFHEAVASQPAPEGSQPNTVLAVVQRGYVIKDRLVRPALVTVTK